MSVPDIDRSDSADARRMRWLLNGNGYFMEEESLCGNGGDLTSEAEQDRARRKIDEEIARSDASARKALGEG